MGRYVCNVYPAKYTPSLYDSFTFHVSSWSFVKRTVEEEGGKGILRKDKGDEGGPH